MASKAIGFLNFKFGADLKGFDRAMKKAQKNLKKFSRNMKRVGKNMTTNLTLPIIGLGVVAVKTFADFEQSMLKVKAISGATAKEFEALEKTAKHLGSTTMFTASQVAELQLNLSKLGLTPEEINKSSEAILSLAQATDSDLGQSATVAAKTMNAFGMEATDMTKIADIMADAFSSTALDMNKFETAMASVAPVAKQAGSDLETTTAILGVLVNNGVEASTAGTALRNIFLDLAVSGKTWDQAMTEINSSVDPLATSLEMFGKRGANVATIISQAGIEIQSLTTDFKDSTGEAKVMADIMDSGVAGSLRKLRSQAEGVAITLGEMLIPIFSKLMNFISKTLTAFKNLDSGTKTMIVSIGLLVAGIGPFITLLGAIAGGLALLISPIGLAVTAILGFTVAFAFVRENYEAFKERLGDWSWWKNALIDIISFTIKMNPLSTLIEGYNNLMVILGKEKIANPFDKLTDGLDGLKTETKEYETTFGSFKDAMINQGTELFNTLKKLSASFNFLGGGTSGEENTRSSTPFFEFGTGGNNFIGPQNMITPEIEIKSLKEKLSDFWEDWGKSIQDGIKAFAKFGQAINGLMQARTQKENIIFRNESKAQEDGLEERYQNRLNNINKTVADEEQRNILIKSLDEDFAEKRLALQEEIDIKENAMKRKQAIRDKSLGIMNAIINTATAVTSVIANPILAGIVGALGAAQVATISSTPIPAFAEGGIISGPTIGLLGEYSNARNNPEVVAPLNKLRSLMSQGTQKIEVIGKLVGNDIYLSNTKTEFNRLRTT